MDNEKAPPKRGPGPADRDGINRSGQADPLLLAARTGQVLRRKARATGTLEAADLRGNVPVRAAPLASVGVSVIRRPEAPPSAVLVDRVTVTTPVVAAVLITATYCVDVEFLHRSPTRRRRSWSPALADLIDLGNRRTALARRQDAFRHPCADRVVLVRRQRNGRQNPDDRNDDHQFDQRKALVEYASLSISLVDWTSRNPSIPRCTRLLSNRCANVMVFADGHEVNILTNCIEWD